MLGIARHGAASDRHRGTIWLRPAVLVPLPASGIEKQEVSARVGSTSVAVDLQYNTRRRCNTSNSLCVCKVLCSMLSCTALLRALHARMRCLQAPSLRTPPAAAPGSTWASRIYRHHHMELRRRLLVWWHGTCVRTSRRTPRCNPCDFVHVRLRSKVLHLHHVQQHTLCVVPHCDLEIRAHAVSAQHCPRTADVQEGYYHSGICSRYSHRLEDSHSRAKSCLKVQPSAEGQSGVTTNPVLQGSNCKLLGIAAHDDDFEHP